jgi:hypothetical protein
MTASKTLVIVLAVLLDALLVVRLKLLEGILNVLHATLDTHLLGAEVGVQTGAIPVSLDGLGVDRHLDTKVFGDTGENKSRNPELIAHCGDVSMCISANNKKKKFNLLAIPTVGPTWYSHWPSNTSAFVPEMWIPA